MGRGVNRRFARRDKNEAPLVKVAKKFGAGWVKIDQKDAGDGIIGYRGQNAMVEFKNPENYGKLSGGQKDFHSTWPGAPPIVIETEDELIALLQRMAGR